MNHLWKRVFSGLVSKRLILAVDDWPYSYTDDIVILLNIIFIVSIATKSRQVLSTNKQRHRLSLLKMGIPVAPTHL